METRLNRRKHPRIEVDLKAEIVRPPGDVVQARALNLSQGGSLIESPMPVPPGEQVEVGLRTSRRVLKPVKARVLRWTPSPAHRNLIALEFEEVNRSLMASVEFDIQSERFTRLMLKLGDS